MHEICYGKSSRASESSCPTTPGLLAEGVIMCSFVKEWLWWMFIYSHILTIAACIWLHIVHRSRNCFEAPQSKRINRGNKEGKACCDSIHWHTTCNPRSIETNANVESADEVAPMLIDFPALNSRHWPPCTNTIFGAYLFVPTIEMSIGEESHVLLSEVRLAT